MACREFGIASGVGALTAALLWGLAACSVGQSGEQSVSEAGGDDASSVDATMETSTVDRFVRDALVGDGRPTMDAHASADAHEGGAACAGVICNGQCTTDVDCSSCAGSPLLCGSQRTCLSACAQCTDDQNNQFPIECFACDAQHQHPLGTCESSDPGSYCLNGNYFAAGGTSVYHCSCDGDAGSCPGASQICVASGATNICLTCGEPVPGSSAGLLCKGGGTCDPDTRACAPSVDP